MKFPEWIHDESRGKTGKSIQMKIIKIFFLLARVFVFFEIEENASECFFAVVTSNPTAAERIDKRASTIE
jgi:hypothetical protein